MRLSSNYKQQGTHNLNLIKAVSKTKGDVCEMGVGFSSTPLLHWITLGRKLVSYESDQDYFHFAKKFISDNHKVRHANREFTNIDYNRHWSVVFIDHSPRKQKKKKKNNTKDFKKKKKNNSPKKPSTRGDDAMKFTNADLMVLHDTEPESAGHYGYDQVFKKYKYRYDWKLCKPYCSIVSNVIDISKWQN